MKEQGVAILMTGGSHTHSQGSLTLGNCSGRFMDARTDGNTPWPEYTNAMMPNTSGSVAQLPATVAAPGGYAPEQATLIVSADIHMLRQGTCMHLTIY